MPKTSDILNNVLWKICIKNFEKKNLWILSSDVRISPFMGVVPWHIIMAEVAQQNLIEVPHIEFEKICTTVKELLLPQL
jgi:hypothetical protein